MSDYTNSKSAPTASYPIYANADSGLVKHVEPLTTAKQVRSRFLKGINLKFPNGEEITDEDIKDKINLALNNIELELQVPIVATQFKDRVAFDKDAYRSFIFIKPKKKPILSVENLRIETTDGLSIFTIPPNWIEAGRFLRGQVNVIPFLASYAGNFVAGFSGNAGLILLASMGGISWIPAYWTITYTSGLCKELGQVPLPVNYLIGIEAALMVLSQLGPTKEFNSVSLGQDGLSQSSSGPGNMQYAKRMEDLEKEKENLIKKIRGTYASKFHVFDF